MIGVNMDGWPVSNGATCPALLHNVGATFVPFSPRIVAHALEKALKHTSSNWEFDDENVVDHSATR